MNKLPGRLKNNLVTTMVFSEKIKGSWKVLKEIFSQFGEDDVFTHSAALSYYTIISLPPMMLIVIQILTFFYQESSVQDAIFSEISALIGAAAAQQLVATLEKLTITKPTWWATAVGIGTLVFTSTTVFVTLQNALNKIFRVKPSPSASGIWMMIRSRVLSFALLLGVAFILLVSLTINALIAAFGRYIERYISEFSFVMAVITSIVLPLAVITVLFAMIFKFLPDAKLRWRYTWFGAFVTALLFSGGRYLISMYIGRSNVAGIYDAAGGVLVIMVWVFYASIIVLLGAVITNVRAQSMHGRIRPSDFAVKVKKKEIVEEEGLNTK